MASLDASTGEVRIELQNNEPKSDVNKKEQIPDNKREKSIYDESAHVQRSVGQRGEKQPQLNSWPVRCFMVMMIAMLVAVVFLATSFVVLVFLTVSLSNEASETRDQLTETSSRIETIGTILEKHLCLHGASEENKGAEIVFQRRERLDVLFNRGFEEYARGFGDICGSGDMWLGLQRLHILTQTGKWNVRILMRQFSDNVSFWDEWTDFRIGSAPLYTLTFGRMVAKSENMRNTTGTSYGFDYHNGMAFSTPDRDQDKDTTGNCAASLGGGGWWYNTCHFLNLNGNKTISDTINYAQMLFYDGDVWKMISSSEMKMIRVA